MNLSMPDTVNAGRRTRQADRETDGFFEEYCGEQQLVVIGNGFDRACGLKSSYEDFFKDRLRAVASIWCYERPEWERVVKEKGLTAWDFILKVSGKGTDWCNVEKAMGDWVLPVKDKPHVPEIIEELFTMLDNWPFGKPHVKFDRNGVSELSERELALRGVCGYVWYGMGHQPGREMNRSLLLAFLRCELGKLEKLFNDYLAHEQSKDDHYRGRAVALLNDITRDGALSSCEEIYDKGRTTVLSFNYTTPFCFSNSVVDESNVVNIHGRLNSEIVFGVDGKECMWDLDALPFTKTYRVASMNVDIGKRLYGTAALDDCESETGAIKFFGHSLGEADYSYFQSIFDAVNLYSGNTRLVFYYRPWTGKKEEELHTEMVVAVTRLLTTYGATLDNKDHGKNLMHKLLLEGRLEIKKLQERA